MTNSNATDLAVVETAKEHVLELSKELVNLTEVLRARSSTEAVLNEYTRAADYCATELHQVVRQDAANVATTRAILDVIKKISEVKAHIEHQRDNSRRFAPMFYQGTLAADLHVIYEMTLRVLEDRLMTLRR